MNGFQKEYWNKQTEIAKENWQYHKYAWLIGIAVNLLFFYEDQWEILVGKIMMLTVLIMGVFEARLNLPNFFIEEDKNNKTEVRVLMIVVPFVCYLLLVFGWFGG